MGLRQRDARGGDAVGLPSDERVGIGPRPRVRPAPGLAAGWPLVARRSGARVIDCDLCHVCVRRGVGRRPRPWRRRVRRAVAPSSRPPGRPLRIRPARRACFFNKRCSVRRKPDREMTTTQHSCCALLYSTLCACQCVPAHTVPRHLYPCRADRRAPAPPQSVLNPGGQKRFTDPTLQSTHVCRHPLDSRHLYTWACPPRQRCAS